MIFRLLLLLSLAGCATQGKTMWMDIPVIPKGFESCCEAGTCAQVRMSYPLTYPNEPECVMTRILVKVKSIHPEAP